MMLPGTRPARRGRTGCRQCFEFGCFGGLFRSRRRSTLDALIQRRLQQEADNEGPNFRAALRNRMNDGAVNDDTEGGDHALIIKGFSDEGLWSALMHLELFWGSVLVVYMHQRLAGAPLIITPRSLANGGYVLAGENHGKPIYRHSRHQAFLYYWDDRDGVTWQGWWLGPHVGSAIVWSFNSSPSALPPAEGWRVPWNGSVSRSVKLIVQEVPGKPVDNPAASPMNAAPNLGRTPNPPPSAAKAALRVPTEQTTPCPVCLEPLWQADPSAFVCNGRRLCCHVLCFSCAQRVAYKQQSSMAWATPIRCPLCRKEGVSLVERLPDIRSDPKRWFGLCDVGGDNKLSQRELADGLACILPTSQEATLAALAGSAGTAGGSSLWATWCGAGPGKELTYDAFQTHVLPWVEKFLQESTRPAS